MRRQRILVTGATGLLGSSIFLEYSARHFLIAGLHDRATALESDLQVRLNMADVSSLEATLRRLKPAIIINCAGLADVDLCEAQPELAIHVNAQLAKNLAQVSSELGIKLVHISTDHLFDGTKSMVSEEATVCPVNQYGRTKAMGEVAVLKHCSSALIIRCNFFGWGTGYRRSFSDFILDSLLKRRSISLANDSFYSPAVIQRLLWGIFKLLDLGATGIFNVVGDDRISKYDFGILLARKFAIGTSNIREVSLASFTNRVIRPADMSLSPTKFVDVVGESLGSIDSNISTLKSVMQTPFYERITQI